MPVRRPMQLRLPDELKTWVKAQAAQNGASQNSEVIRALRERMERAEQGHAEENAAQK